MADGFDADYARFLNSDRNKAAGFAIENDAFTLKNAVPEELAEYRLVEVSASKAASAQEKIGAKDAAAAIPQATADEADDLKQIS